jgi:putative MATE family efflux protein
VDTFFVARLGSRAVGGLAVVFPIQMVLVAMGAGSGIGLNSYVSRRLGARDPRAASHAAAQVFFLSAVLGLAAVLAARWWTDPLLALFGATPTLAPVASEYLRIVCLGAPLILFTMMTNNLFRAQGDALLPMLVMLSGAVTNIVLDPLLIFGLGPFPELGVAGAAIATVASQAIGASLALWFLLTRTAYSFDRRNVRPDPAVLGRVYSVGLPAVAMQVLMSAAVTLFNHVLGPFGDAAIASAGISFRLIGLFSMPVLGLAQGLVPIVGYNYGARRPERLWEAWRFATAVAAAVGLAATCTALLLGDRLIGAFSDEAELVSIAVPALRLLTASLSLGFASIVWTSTFQAVGRGNEALALAAVRQLVLIIPLLLVLPGRYGLAGAWLAMPLADVGGFAIALAAVARLRRGLGDGEPVPTEASSAGVVEALG